MKRTKMNSQQKKDTAVIAVLSIVAILLLVFCVKAFRTENVPVVNTTVSEETTSANVTTGTTAEPPVTTTKPAQTTKPVVTTSSAETTKVVAVDETAEILKVVSDGVNALKASDASFTGHKVQSIDIHLVDSSVPAVNNIINGVIKAFVKEEIYDYDFTNGVADDPESDGTIDSDDAFPPGDKPFELTREGVASARKNKDGENTVYTVVIVSETSTLENPRPPHHNAGADTLDLSDVEIPIITLTKVDFDYPGAEISVTVDPDGNVVGYHEHLKISGTGEGNGLGITGYGTIEGYIDEKWDISWK